MGEGGHSGVPRASSVFKVGVGWVGGGVMDENKIAKNDVSGGRRRVILRHLTRSLSEA